MAKRKDLIGAIVDKVIKKLGPSKRLSEEEMTEAWKMAAGEAAATHSRPVGFRRSSMIVNVDESGWLYELTLDKRGIITRLKDSLKDRKLKDIRFRIGEVSKVRHDG
jgi:predicted nucleic acid-binding Zn ribbon protein